ncbi:MAG TPA: hypothetical protein VNJ03_00835 [Vicinamibacterales bacterium]|nr:hypothetical protein [Vicinamibacterales bacterium]
MNVNGIVSAMVAGCAVVVMSAGSGLAAQATQATAAVAPPSMAPKCQAMMDAQEKMIADQKVADQALDRLVATMNAAPGTRKTAATAAVVTEMVAQTRSTRAGMMKMHQDMVSHTAEHMQAGKDSMATCPLTKK